VGSRAGHRRIAHGPGNATPNPVSQQVAAVAGQRFELNPYQRTGSDPIVKQAGYQANTGTFTVPGRTVAVFQSPG
jgi:hypothetical protein